MLLPTIAIFETMQKAGFPPTVAVTMTAIALRESGGDPGVFNNNPATGDRSYGLLQINMKSPEVAALLKAKIAEVAWDEKSLLQPDINARAGFLLYGWSIRNLNIAWYIDKPVYQQRYEQHLPAAQAAALQFLSGIT